MIYRKTIIFDGKKLAAQKEEVLKKKARELSKRGIAPKLVSILVGDNPASLLYLRLKQKIAERVGILFEIKKFSAKTSVSLIRDFIEEKNNDPLVSGIMVQLPLPAEFRIQNSEFRIVEAIASEKDVDCLTSINLQLLKQGQPRFLPATTKAILEILKVAAKKLEGKKIVVVGAKGFVGKPLVDYLQSLKFNVLGLDKETRDLGKETQKADILISATGMPGLIKKEMVKKGAVVIDVGSPKGDVDFEEVKKVASFITPVPGGVGPLTVVSLFENLLLDRD